MSTRHRAALLAAAATLLVAACNSPYRQPATNSISDLTFETRDAQGRLLKHEEVTAIAGLMPIPDVGAVIHYSVHNDPTTAIGVSRDHSFKLVGESACTATANDIAELREALVTASTAAESAALAMIAVMALRAEIARLDVPATLTDVAAQMKQQRLSILRQELASAAALHQEADDALANAEAEVRKKSSRPGVIVARWTAATEDNAGIKAGRFVEAGGSSSTKLGGFVILGCVRVQMLYFGDDFFALMKYIAEKKQSSSFVIEADMLGFASFSTYQLQARHVSYAAVQTLSESFRLRAAFKIRDLYGLSLDDLLDEEIALAYYAERVASLANSGVISEMNWSKMPYCFLSGTDLPDLDSHSDGWSTVVVQNVSPSFWSGALLKSLRDWQPVDPAESGREPCTTGTCGAYPEVFRR
jgi:hypothetical protein